MYVSCLYLLRQAISLVQARAALSIVLVLPEWSKRVYSNKQPVQKGVDCLRTVFQRWIEALVIQIYLKQFWRVCCELIPCGGGFEYFLRSPASRRSWRKGNPVPGVITGPPSSVRFLQVGGWSQGWQPCSVKYYGCEIQRSENWMQSGRIF
jgi:hypothetical protein